MKIQVLNLPIRDCFHPGAYRERHGYTMEQKELLRKITEVVRECGEIILHADRNKSAVDEKAGHANFVTEYDKRIQQILHKPKRT